tara:strand:+ start:291 stop:734 length:444 start_codon:yes stop_codon:yes gene_type:complete
MADLNTSFSATGNLTASDPLSISTGTVKLTVNDPVETGVSSIATSATNTLLAYATQAANDYWVYMRNNSATAVDVVVKLNVAAADISGASGFTRNDWGTMTLKQNDWAWFPISGTGMSGKTEATGLKITNTSGSAVATIEYGLYKKN